MRLVAIAAGHACRKHLALLKRAVIVDFVEHLSVGVIEAAGQIGDQVGVGQWQPWYPVLGELCASRMTQAAGLDFPAYRSGRDVAVRIAGLGIGLPGHPFPFVEEHGKPLQRVLIPSERPPTQLTVCPVDVP